MVDGAPVFDAAAKRVAAVRNLEELERMQFSRHLDTALDMLKEVPSWPEVVAICRELVPDEVWRELRTDNVGYDKLFERALRLALLELLIDRVIGPVDEAKFSCKRQVLISVLRLGGGLEVESMSIRFTGLAPWEATILEMLKDAVYAIRSLQRLAAHAAHRERDPVTATQVQALQDAFAREVYGLLPRHD